MRIIRYDIHAAIDQHMEHVCQSAIVIIDNLKIVCSKNYLLLLYVCFFCIDMQISMDKTLGINKMMNKYTINIKMLIYVEPWNGDA